MGACCDNRSESAAMQKGGAKQLKSNYNASKLNMPAMDDAKERARVEEIWKKFDTNKSGKLEKDQAKLFLLEELASLTGAEPTDDELERNFNIIDEDANGSLDKEEVLKFLKGFGLGFTLRNLMRSEAGQN